MTVLPPLAGLSAPLTIAAAVDAAAAALAGSSPSARIDAEVLVRHAGGVTRAEAIAQPQRLLPSSQCAALATLIERRQRGEPIAYLIGRREFWSLELGVSPATLIPRPETELLVERALVRIPPQAAWVVADLGTGCGAIALALAAERPRLTVVATDRSEQALALARANAARLRFTNIEFHAGDWFTPLRERRFHLVVSNPPYLRAHDAHLGTGDLRFEPRAALVAGADGLSALRHIAGAARAHLHPGGWLLLEHGFDQAEAVRALLAGYGYGDVQTYKDLNGHDRVAEAQRG